MKDSFFKEDGKLKGLTKEVTDLETRLKQDFGEDGQFAALADRWALHAPDAQDDEFQPASIAFVQIWRPA